ncbi:MAG: hypothetical protein WCG52_10600 [bacterium]
MERTILPTNVNYRMASPVTPPAATPGPSVLVRFTQWPAIGEL